ncbi:5-methylthioribose kinase [Paenibacillus anaericanus]|uniref:S-methyl-5-thioribose kinase n=1 Tax=Paenibacillus anaericanus TaxID=170367 RepID=UPI00278216E4|nr:S-methyl-5-thioribose kinase [Paenibacillus anaericanus]MDQ0087103.1 5-methylthioribose kinase [Paenibacillus anaericanus]
MSQYYPLSLENAIVYARSIPDFFTADANLRCEEIGDGNLNLVFKIEDPISAKSLIVKQALPYAKVVGESWPLSLDRARIEREALVIQHTLCPDLVPIVYGGNQELAITVMEDLSDHTIMRKGLIDGNTYPRFPEHIGRFIAHTLFYTSDLGMNQQRKKEQAARFVNPDLCKITEDLIFEDPYRDVPNNDFSEDIILEVKQLWEDTELHLEVALLREKFLTHGEALLHGDLHTGSIFVTAQSTKVIDPEFAFYGPMGFDLGAIIANLLLNLTAQPGWSDNTELLEERRQWLLTSIKNVWDQFENHFRRLWNDYGIDPISKTPGYQNLYIQKVLRDAVGFAGCKMIRRIVGLSHVADIETIQDDELRHQAKVTALQIGKALLKYGRSTSSIDEIIDLTKQIVQTEGVSL